MTELVRTAERDDLPLLPEVERASDGMFQGVSFPPGSVLDELGPRHTVLVAGRPPVGFLVTGPVDDAVHVHQLSVHPRHGRRGIGSALLETAVRRAGASGAGLVSLTTFRHVPWNEPWYLDRGFVRFPAGEQGPELRLLIETELAAGLTRIGPRVTLCRHLHGR